MVEEVQSRKRKVSRKCLLDIEDEEVLVGVLEAFSLAILELVREFFNLGTLTAE